MIASASQEVVETVDAFQQLLRELTGLRGDLPGDTSDALRTLLATLGPASIDSPSELATRFYRTVNRKLGVNRAQLATLYTRAAAKDITFNYHQKSRLSSCIDSARMDLCAKALEEMGVSAASARALLNGVEPATSSETRQALADEAHKPSKLRKALDRSVTADVMGSCAGPLAWALWPAESLYAAFGSGGAGDTTADYLSFLRARSPELFERERTLSVRFVATAEVLEVSKTRSALSAWLADEYQRLNNHGFIAAVLEVDPAHPGPAWATAHDAMLYAERFKETRLRQMFFRSKEVARETTAHIPGLNEESADFGILNEGFTYRDLFVLTDPAGVVIRLVLVMQKNLRDETTIPCPDCRSTHVEGNSYPTLGVKSWECQNLLCPARSIYNRGRRFQFKSVISQAAIEDPQSRVSVASVRRWQRDVLEFESDQEIVETLVTHYSMWGDGIAVINAPERLGVADLGRRTSFESLARVHARTDFWDSAFFHRYRATELHEPLPERSGLPQRVVAPTRFTTIHGDSNEVLKSIPTETFDRAVTSPPYFNAREYSQWPNLYAYLYDMAENAREVHRVLKPGGIYAYNIFDYFDNERTVVFSDMGKKRIALASLVTDAFLRIGFELVGVIPWDKGEIQGKRGFNAGNFSPFYQSPFNCWEHVLLLRKAPGPETLDSELAIPADIVASVTRIQPVIKMVRGQNTYGHTAPYPLDLVSLLLSGLAKGSLVLDPYGGSGTTARAAHRAGMRSVMIERDPAYAQLCTKMTEDFIAREDSMLPLFD
ncbi:hypothetical protein Dac01nite_12980 [Demequina activiva]|uniref:site-specific DNA-methyltransferase (cytosine-N(4)-specific) n=2 Tax=Demequina activiva TaxID=1582364 RepID=A0A919Q439_9MICO|nr:hypothetical protein Dac01nite_12980 [Demequina activiva]